MFECRRWAACLNGNDGGLVKGCIEMEIIVGNKLFKMKLTSTCRLVKFSKIKKLKNKTKKFNIWLNGVENGKELFRYFTRKGNKN